jgi:hypothetical protein
MDPITPSKWTFRFGAILSLAAVATIGTTFMTKSTLHESESNNGIIIDEQRQLTSSNDYIEKIIVSNEYGESVSGSEYPWLSGRLVVEPHKQTSLFIGVNSDNANNHEVTDVIYKWTITDPNGEVFKTHGSTIVRTFREIGKHSISINVYSKDGSTLLSTYNVDASCLYVKRELRKLTEEDRENFLDAMYEIWRLTTIEGRKIYGQDFTGIDRFVYIHTKSATGDIWCDEWHEGTGFLVHHLALSTSFDLSLRAIDKRVSIPYWDFSIEGEKLSKAGLGPKALTMFTPLLTDEWFGEIDTKTNHIKNSRWKHTKAIKAIPGSKIRNSYGYIRAPWNNANDKELIRHLADVCGLEPVKKPVPGCSAHYTVISSDTLPDFFLSSPGTGHGPMHVNMGGSYGECTGGMAKFYENNHELLKQKVSLAKVNDKIIEKTGSGYGWKDTTEFTLEAMVQKYVHMEYFHIYRTLYRSQTCALDGLPGALTCPESCNDEDEVQNSDCVCTCKGIDSDGTVTDEFDWKNLEPCIHGSGTSEILMSNTLSESVRKELVTSICTSGVKEGEMVESSSTLDPMFFMIHPVLDRLLAAKRLSAVSNINFGSYGQVQPFSSEDWLDMSYYNTEDHYCQGHSMYDPVLNDLTLPSSLISLADTNDDGVINNIEFYDVIDPLNEDGISYIFDDFTWDHCTTSSSSSSLSSIEQDVVVKMEQNENLDENYEFFLKMEPTKWDGEYYQKNLKDFQYKIKESIPIQQYHNEVKQGMKPGINLMKTAKVVGSKKEYDNVLNILESNSKTPEIKYEGWN